MAISDYSVVGRLPNAQSNDNPIIDHPVRQIWIEGVPRIIYIEPPPLLAGFVTNA